MAIEGLVVIEVAQLARLTNSLATSESPMTVKLKTIVNVVKVAHVEQKGADCGACATFA